MIDALSRWRYGDGVVIHGKRARENESGRTDPTREYPVSPRRVMSSIDAVVGVCAAMRSAAMSAALWPYSIPFSSAFVAGSAADAHVVHEQR